MTRRNLSAGLAFVASALFVLFSGARGFSQSAAPKPATNQSGSQPAVLRVSTRMVQVNVIVQEKDGSPVTGLTKDDFSLFDKGQLQRIAYFAEQNSLPAPIQTATVEAPPPTNQFSNRTNDGFRPATKVTVILLDSVNTDASDMSIAQAQVLKFVREMQPGDQVAIYLLTSSKLYVLHDLTNDSATLVRVMGGVKRDKTSRDPDVIADDANNKRLHDSLTDAFAESNRFYKGTPTDKVAVTSWGFRNIATRLNRFPGRKNLVWISGAFPIQTGFGTASTATIGGIGERRNFAGAISSTSQALSDADVAVYPVDVRGLIAPCVLCVLNGSAGEISAAAPDDGPFETMLSVAAGTSGKAFYNTNDISGAIRRAIDDSRVTYVLGYYPDHNKWDGSFRQITVKVNRRGVQLRYRNGYFATEEGSNSADTQKQVLATALCSPVQIMDLGLEVQVNPANSAGSRQVRAQIRVLPGELHFQQSGSRWTDGLEVAWVEFSGDGREVGHGAHAFGVRPAQGGYEEIMQKGLIFSERVTVNNGAAEMRLVVRDIGSGAIGSVNIPLSGLFAPNTPPAPVKK